jgi:hypothetical protein
MSAIRTTGRKLCGTLLMLGLSALSGCGGGGGGSAGGATGSGGPASSTVTGQIVKGPVALSTVRLFSVAADGTKTLLATTVTDLNGKFTLSAPQTTGSVSIIEATGGTYADEFTGQLRTPDTSLRAAFIADSQPVDLTVTVFSELAVRRLDSASPRRYSAADVNASNSAVSAKVRVSDVLKVHPLNMRMPQDFVSTPEDQLFFAIFIGAFSAVANQLDNDAGNESVDRAVLAIFGLFLTDPFDDQFGPKFIRAIFDFIEITVLPELFKAPLRSSFLATNSVALSRAQAATLLPTGSATGTAKAALADGRYQMVSDQAGGSDQPIDARFNGRGALYAYSFPSSAPLFNGLFSASVGELYGDSEVSIGRWHGGQVMTFNDSGDKSPKALTSRFLGPNADIHYALGTPATGLPACGVRTYRLAGQTRATVRDGLTNAVPRTIGLDDTSAIAIQFGPALFVALDLQIRKTDGSLESFKSLASLATPAPLGLSVGANQRFDFLLDNTAPGTAFDLQRVVDGRALLAGIGGRKIVLYLQPRIGLASVPTTAIDQYTAVFEATDAGVAPGSCV